MKIKKYFWHLMIIIIASLSFLMWHKVFFHYMMGESLTYFRPGYEQIIGMTYPGIENIFRYDIFARITFATFEHIFRDNLLPFNIFLIIILILLPISFLFMVYELTKSKAIAFMSAIFFGLNFIYLAEMVGFGYFQWVYERVPNFIFSFISFIFFVKYLRQKNYKHYFISLALFTLSILSAHFSLFFLPFFIFYSIAFTIFNKKERKNLKRRIIDLVPFFAIAYFLVTTKPSVPPTPRGKTFTDTLKDKDLFSDIFYQITLSSVPLQVLNYINENFDLRSIVPKLYAPVGILYGVGSLILLKIKREFGIIMVACVFSLIAVSILNLHVHKMSVVNWRPLLTNHYFMVLGFFVPIIWSISLYLIGRKNKLFFVVIIIFLFNWIYLNIQTFWEYDKKNEYNNILHHRMHNFVKNNYSTFKDNSLIVYPVDIGDHVIRFYEKFYRKPSVIYKPIYRITQKDAVRFNPDRDVILDFASDKYTIIYRTKEYKEIFSKKTTWYEENMFW